MTKTFKITAVIAAVLLLLGALFKTSHWPGANVILFIGTGAGIIFLIMMISEYVGKLALGFEQFNGIFASLALIVGLLAFIFKIFHWTGANTLVWIADMGIFFSGTFFLVDGLLEKERSRSALKLIAGFFILMLSLVLLLGR